MDEKSMWKGLLGNFQNGIDTPSASAFVQQWKKLLPQAFEDLFHRFTDTLTAGRKFQGCRLLAIDGTSLKSMSYPEDSDAYRSGTQRQHGWNLYHINALFDLENGIYTDVLVQKEPIKSENATLCEMVGRSAVSEPVILLADRGYEAYNNIAHLEQAGWKYLIRLKDRDRTYTYKVTLPNQPKFDLPVHIILGRLTRRQLEQRGIPIPKAYCRLPNNVPFDYLKPGSAGFYLFSARIVRLRLKDGSMETFITNLNQTQFPLAVLRRLYARRWGIETSFRQLKYTVGMVYLHSKQPELILQGSFPPLSSSTLQRPLPGRLTPHGAAPNINAASISLMRSISAAKLCGAGFLTYCPSYNIVTVKGTVASRVFCRLKAEAVE